jgi:hypothetical protein
VLAEQSGLRSAGTAPVAGFWVALEQTGPWGPDVAVDSHLDPRLGRTLERTFAAAGGRLALIRAPGAHPDVGTRRRHCLVAYAGRVPWLLAGDVAGPADLLDLDVGALAAGDRDAVLARSPWLGQGRPALLVCTNGRRDVCCSVRGRPVALDAARAAPGRVWESSHTGGHRFAPTGVVLPHGRLYARLDARLASLALDAADRGRLPQALLGEPHDRGASRLAPPAQAAEAAVRAAELETRVEALDVALADAGAGGYAARVRHADGREWEVTVTREQGLLLAQSCGSDPVRPVMWAVTGVQRVPL